MPEESNLKGVKENVAVPTKTPWYQNTNTLNTLNGVFLFGTHLLGTPKEYDGPKGEITQVSNAVYDLAADVVGLFNPLAGTIMKGGALLAGITNKLGGGTDGMTSLDAFLGSTLGQLSGLGIVNGAFGKKSDTFKANDYVIAQSRSSYGNTFDVFNNAAKKSGKKYGLTSSKDRKAANAEIAQAGRQLTQLKYLINDRDMAQESMAGSIDLYNLGYMNELMRAKTGTKFPNKKQINKAKMMARKYQLGNKINKLLTPLDIDKMVEDADKLVPTFKFDISMFLHGGKPKKVLSDSSYYDKDTNTVYYSGEDRKSRKESLKHELFHANPNKDLLLFIEPYYKDLNDEKIVELGGDLDYVKRLNGDPNYFYNPEEIGARLVAAAYRTRNVPHHSLEFFEELRKTDSKYGDNMRDLLHMYNNDNLVKLFSYFFSQSPSAGSFDFQDPNGEIGYGNPLKATGLYDSLGRELYIDANGDTFTLYKKGGKLTATPNIIPEGALHARLHHLEDENPELKGEITTKGIPVVSKEDGGIVQLAEIERNEIILNKELTDKIEKFYKEYNDSTDDKKKDELAIEVGKILTCEILNNTIDKTGLLNEEANL